METNGEAIVVKKQITLFQAINFSVGVMIGSGIFVSPYGVLMNVKSVGLSLIIWILCGVFNLIGAFCYAELGTTFPRSGGDYTYILRGLGRLPAFLSVWMCCTILMPVGAAACGLVFATYLLKPIYPDCLPPENAIRLIATASILLLVITNGFNIGWAAKIQIASTFSAVIALLIIFVFDFIVIIQDRAQNTFIEPFQNTDYSPGSIALAFYSGFWAFSGWKCLNNIVDELENPYRDLPRAIVVSAGGVTVIYLLANMAYMAVMSTPQMLSSTAVALTFAERTMGKVSIIMPLFVASAIVGTLNGAIVAVSRKIFVAAQDGNLPAFFSMIHYKWRTPIPALILMSGFSIALTHVSDIFTLIEVIGFGLLLIVTLTYISMVKLRYTEPDIHRPIKINIVLPILMMIVCLVFIIVTVVRKPIETAICLGIIASGIPLYIVAIQWKNKPKSFENKQNELIKLLQKVLVVIPQDITPNQDMTG